MAYSTLVSERILPPAVSAFADRHELLATLHATIRLAQSSFDPVEEPRVELEADAETGDEFVVITVSLAAGIEEVLKRYNAFTSRRLLILPAKGQEFIRLTYDILD